MRARVRVRVRCTSPSGSASSSSISPYLPISPHFSTYLPISPHISTYLPIQVYLAKRLGFVKLALQHSAALVPCYAFGVVDLYSVTPAQHRSNSQGARWALSKKYGVAVPSYSG